MPTSSVEDWNEFVHVAAVSSYRNISSWNPYWNKDLVIQALIQQRSTADYIRNLTMASSLRCKLIISEFVSRKQYKQHHSYILIPKVNTQSLSRRCMWSCMHLCSFFVIQLCCAICVMLSNRRFLTGSIAEQWWFGWFPLWNTCTAGFNTPRTEHWVAICVSNDVDVQSKQHFLPQLPPRARTA